MMKLIIIQASDQSAANAYFIVALGNSWSNVFHVGLSASGSAPATNYWASMFLNASQLSALDLTTFASQFPTALIFDWDDDNDPGFPNRELATLGLQRVIS